ncbi:MAG: hypothetical protein QM811_30455 [Pirellulales bacterium]
MSDFDARLQKAIRRGQSAADDKQAAAHAAALTEEQFRRLHSNYRLQLSEHIEACVAKLPDYFPGFVLEHVSGDRGWGAAVTRNDVHMSGGKATTLFSRMEATVLPYSAAHVIEIAARGTIRNKEVLQRRQYRLLAEVQIDALREQLDLWIIDYAELYAANG